jgi:hypothetical protein
MKASFFFFVIISHFVKICMEVKMGFSSCRNHFFILLEGEATGRLLRYDPPTKTTHVVLEGLAFPNGVQLSRDQTFLLFTETTNCRYFKQTHPPPPPPPPTFFLNKLNKFLSCPK